MSKKGLLKFICISFLLWSNYLSSQNIQEKKLLTEILKSLEKRYDCNFSYSNKDLEDIEVIPPSEELSFSEAINYLKNKTAFSFNLLEERLITVIKLDGDLISICGTILDQESQFPVQNANVNTEQVSTLSDKNGFFRIDNIKVGDVLTISHIGYNNLSITINEIQNNDCLKLLLRPNIQELDEVLIANFITKGISKSTNGSVHINYNQFGILPGLIETDALQTVQSLPSVNSLDETVTNINIRGGSHDQNLITWNHIKMYQTGHFFNLISAISPNMTNRATLYKNGTPSQFTDGVSGTINVKSSDNIAKDFKTTLGLNLIEANALLDIPLGKKASIHISGRRSYSDVMKTYTSDRYFEKAFQNTEVIQNESNVISEDDNFRFFDIEAVLNYHITPKDKLQVSFIAMKNDLSFFESAFVQNQEESRESSSEQRNLGLGLVYNHIWNDKLSSTFKFYGLQYDLNARNVDILNDKQLIQENNIDEWEITILSHYQLNNKIKINGGYSFNESGIYNLDESNNPLFKTFSKDVLRKHAMFTEFNYSSLNKKTHLTTGLRANYIQPFNQFIVEPRLRFSQRLLENLSWDVLGEFKHQTTTQTVDLQNDFLGVENRRWIASNNDNIPIIKSKQLSTGLTYKNNDWLINFEMFYKNVKGIVAQSQEFLNQFQFRTDSGNYSGTGFDIFMSKRINDLSCWGSYSYQDLYYQFSTLQKSNFPNNFNINHTLNLGVSYNYQNFKIATGIQFRTGRAITNPIMDNEVIDGEINYESPNASNLPRYFRWDASLTYDFKLRKSLFINTGISLWNITNKRNTINKYYELPDSNLPSAVTQNALEFTPNAIIKIRF